MSRPPLVLASRSPQRRAILAQLDIPFVVEVPAVEEVRDDDPREMVLENAARKARAVAGERVLGVDTAVFLDGRSYGKPTDADEARRLLEALAGRRHEVWSGIALRDGGEERSASAVTGVTFRALASRELDWYLASEEWRERAGGYAIQGLGAALVEAVEGDFWNVVGLPVAELLRLAPELVLEAADPMPAPDRLGADPIEQFRLWLDAASARGGEEATAMTLATADREGRPSARTVLLKGVDERGFAFFTNAGSRKGRELAENASAALVFRWPALARQVCVTGSVTAMPRDESDAYFRSRPRGSRLSAHASPQSQVIESRSTLEEAVRALDARFPGDSVPRPEQWGGNILAPDSVEFWQGRPHRLHDRLRYRREARGGWQVERLAP